MEVKEHAPGSFSWFELATSDSGGAKKFYTTLFGWTTLDHDMGENGVYTMWQKGSGVVGAMYQDNKPGVPPHWSTYITVANVDDTAGKVEGLGGKVIAPPFDVMDVGRMAVVQDPTGAFFCLWQAKQHIGATVVDEPGAFCWDELMTNDVPAAAAFYTKLIGWKTKGEPGVAEYVEWINGGRSIGGLMATPPDAKAMGVPPNWLPYVCVSDCDGTTATAKSLGGKAYVEPRDIPDVGRFAVLADPQGAGFAIVQIK